MVVDVLEQLLQLEVPLRCTWNETKLVGKRSDEDDDEAEEHQVPENMRFPKTTHLMRTN